MKKDDKKLPEVQKAEVQETAALPGAQATAPRRYTVTPRFGLNLRQNPDANAPVLRVLPRGAIVETFGEASMLDGVCWQFLEFEGGWVDSAYLREADE